MTGTSFRIRGINFEQWARRFDPERYKQAMANLLAEALAEGIEEAKRLCPVDTGYMFGQIYGAVLNERTAVIGCDCSYAIHNEWGWRGIPAIGTQGNPKFHVGGYRPFLRPGIYKMQDIMIKKAHLLFDEE